MKSASTPLVSVVTPVYNGAAYLGQCIESVLSQTYSNWEYTIVDNCSRDGSLEIAQSYASRDPRISVLSNPDHLSAVDNWNYSARQMSPQSSYCKILHADDWLFPECLGMMVEVAEANPSVAMVSSYVLVEKVVRDGERELVQKRVRNTEISYPNQCEPGHKIAQGFLLHSLPLSFAPSAQLIRSDFIRRKQNLYDGSTGVYGALDCQVALELLEDGDFGFVHQILVCAREHAESLTSAINRHSLLYPETMRLLKRFGQVYLTRDEYQAAWKNDLTSYFRFLGRSLCRLRGRRFWQFHRAQFRQLECRLGLGTLFSHAAREAIRLPGELLARVEQRWRLNRRRQAPSSAGSV